jgi:hypothetical protein
MHCYYAHESLLNKLLQISVFSITVAEGVVTHPHHQQSGMHHHYQPYPLGTHPSQVGPEFLVGMGGVSGGRAKASWLKGKKF